MTKVGLISDTHGLLRNEALAALVGSDLILHAGDIGDEAILDRLRQIAPVHAVRGNNDVAHWTKNSPLELDLKVEQVSIRMMHDVADFSPGVQPPAVLVIGHSHRPRVERRNGVLEVNPGSSGPRRFSLPISVATLSISGGQVTARIIELEITLARVKNSTPRLKSG